MRLTFTKDIKREDGTVRWPAGSTHDWSRETWKGISDSVGLPLGSITRSPDEIARDAIAGRIAEKSPRRESDAAPQTRVRHRRAA